MAKQHIYQVERIDLQRTAPADPTGIYHTKCGKQVILQWVGESARFQPEGFHERDIEREITAFGNQIGVPEHIHAYMMAKGIRPLIWSLNDKPFNAYYVEASGIIYGRK